MSVSLILYMLESIRETTIDECKAMWMRSSYVLRKQIVAPGFIDYVPWLLTNKDITELTMHGLTQVTINAPNHIIRVSKIFYQMVLKIQYLVSIFNYLKKYKDN